MTFTDAQKEQIKTLVESGKTMDAQKIILKELGSEFGGAAEAATDPWQRLHVVFGNVKESIGTALLPALDAAATFMTDTFIPAAQRWWKTHGPAVKQAFENIATTVNTFYEGLRDNLEPQLARIQQAWEDNREAITELTSAINTSNDATSEGADTAKSFGDAIVGVTTFAGQLAAALKATERVLNAMNESFQEAGHDIHVSFVRPLIRAFGEMVRSFLDANHKIIKAAATTAEALHLPMAKGLRKAEQRMGGFVKDFNHKLDQLNDEGVNLKIASQFNIPGMSVHDIVGKAAGGPLEGPGPRGKDSMLFRGAPGEHVWTDREVTAAGGHGAMERWRKAVLAGDLPGFERGGAIHPHLGLPPTGRIAGAISGALDRFARAMERTYGLRPQFTGGSGAGFGSGSWTRAISELRRESVPYSIMSTFRAGARTRASGSVSFHSLNRAVDLSGPNMLRIWQALTDTNPTELIYSAAPVYKSRRGWSPINRLDPITRADHWNHVHAAYDQGGWLPTGTSIATNTTGKAEPVGFDYERMADAFVAALESRPPAVYLDRQKVSRAVRTGDLWESRR